MRVARFWHGGRLLLTWFVVSAGLGIFCWSLRWGVYEPAFEDLRVVHVSGYWSSEFAVAVSAFASIIVVAMLTGCTIEWHRGRKERKLSRIIATSRHRRLLM